MDREKLNILAIGKNCKGATCYKRIIAGDPDNTPVTVDCAATPVEAYKKWQAFDYDCFLICDKNENKDIFNKLKYCAGEYSDTNPCDRMTGFCNRSLFLSRLRHMDLKKHLPISIIIGDLDDIKLINDVFGYDKGDHVIKNTAGIFKNTCPSGGIFARWGGDEFAVALPKTPENLSQKIMDTIGRECGKADTVPMKSTIALGAATKEKLDQDILDTLHKAEAELCLNKVAGAKSRRYETIASLVKLLGEKNYETEEHAWRMQNLAIEFGLELGLTDCQMEDLILAVTLHDIGKLAVPEQILIKPGKLTPAEWAIIKEHSAKGYRIALSSNKFARVAPVILSHHERWDGRGYPQGLKGEEIPFLSRIVTIVDSYDVMTNERPYKKAMGKMEARKELEQSAGSQFDPGLIKVFLSLDL